MALIPGSYTSSGDGFLKIFVGSARKEFLVHKKLVCSRSEFFEKCVGSGQFRESETGEIHLQDDDPDAFGVVVDWLYNFNMVIANIERHHLMVAAWILADKLMMAECKNDIMEAVSKYNDTSPALSVDVMKALPLSQLRRDQPMWQHLAHKFVCDLMADVDSSGLWTDDPDLRLQGSVRDFLSAEGNFATDILEMVLLYHHHNDRPAPG